MFTSISPWRGQALVAAFILIANKYAGAINYSYKLPENYDMNPAGTAPDSNNTLNCTEPLPLVGYPPGASRLDWNNLTQLCGTSHMQCSPPPPRGPEFNGTFSFNGFTYSFMDSNNYLLKACALGCYCAQPQDIGMVGVNGSYKAVDPPPSCGPTKVFPAGQSIDQLRNPNPLPFNCEVYANATASDGFSYEKIYTYFNRTTNVTSLCEPCLQGFVDPLCKQQPIPLPNCGQPAAINATKVAAADNFGWLKQDNTPSVS